MTKTIERDSASEPIVRNEARFRVSVLWTAAGGGLLLLTSTLGFFVNRSLLAIDTAGRDQDAKIEANRLGVEGTRVALEAKIEVVRAELQAFKLASDATHEQTATRLVRLETQYAEIQRRLVKLEEAQTVTRAQLEAKKKQ
jgi:hypothetical protein